MEEREETKAAENRIQEMLEDAKRIVEEARNEARELRRRARTERRVGRKKEKVLNLRIGSDLEERIRNEAQRLSVPVSSLVRNVLDNAFELVDGITENVSNLVEDVLVNAGEVGSSFKSAVKGAIDGLTEDEAENSDGALEKENPPKIGLALLNDVAAWREVTLGKPASCAVCNISIPRWNKAHAGQSIKTKQTLFLCEKCIENLKRQEEELTKAASTK